MNHVRWTLWPALGLSLLFLGVSLSLSLVDSATSDEAPHLAAGLSYLESGDVMRANPQHPPLLKELSALFLRWGGVRWPASADAYRLLHGPSVPGRHELDWRIGFDIIYRQGPDRVMFWGRLPLVLLGTMLVLVLYFWGRQLTSSLAALGAAFLCVCDPIILAHAHLITTDVGLAALTVLFLFALWNYIDDPNWRRLVLCGLLLGAAMTTKFSGIFLLPIAGVLLFWAVLRPPQGIGRPRRALDPFLTSPSEASSSVRITARNSACPCGSGKKYKHCHGVAHPNAPAGEGPARRLLLCACVLTVICVSAFLVIQAVYLFPSDPLAYLKGLDTVNADHNPNYAAYMAGELKQKFISYFAVAWLLKEPLASIVLAGMGLIVLVRSKTIPQLGKVFLTVPPAVFFLAATLWADNLGVRYIMPVLPFTHLWGGLALAALVQTGRKWGSIVAGTLCAWLALAATGAYPAYIPYFNETACLLDGRPGSLGIHGGTRCGPSWLDDSNVEWGQGLKELKAWLDRNGKGRIPRMRPLSTLPPEVYGIRAVELGLHELVRQPKPGLYVISAHALARYSADAANDWMRRIRPAAIVAQSYYVYEIPASPADSPAAGANQPHGAQ